MHHCGEGASTVGSIRQSDFLCRLVHKSSPSPYCCTKKRMHVSGPHRPTSVWTCTLCRTAPTSEDIHELETVGKQGCLDKELGMLLSMDQRGVVPSVQMYKNLLQACSKKNSLHEAKLVHAHLSKHGLESNRMLLDLVVTTLVNCGSLADGLQLFQRLPRRTVFSWTAIITGYSNAGQCREAIQCYKQMQQEGVWPDSYTFVSVLKACSKLEDLEEGKRIHAAIVCHGLESDMFVASTLISMYAKCGSMMDAQHVFDGLSQRNVVSWTAMVAAYAQKDQGDKALQIFWQMQEEGIGPDSRTFVSALQACGSLAEREEKTVEEGQSVKKQSLQKGRIVHAAAVESCLESDSFVGNSLVSMYAKCGSLKDAQVVFDGLYNPNLVSWNAMMAAHAQQDQGAKALQIFQHVQEKGVMPDARTFVTALQACSSLAENEVARLQEGKYVKFESLHKARKIHAAVTDRGLELNVFVGSSLVSVYAKCWSIEDAEQVFERLSNRNVVCWSAMIAAYFQQELGEKALQMYARMQEAGFRPNARTFASTLQACGSLAEREQNAVMDGQTVKLDSLQKGREIHARATELGFESDTYVANSLVSMYAKCGSINDATEVFDKLSQRDVVSWNAMIAAYSQQEQGDKALQLYARMLAEGVKPREGTFVAVLEACGSTGALEICRGVHQTVVECGFHSNLPITTSLIRAYGKCGSMSDAQQVFNSLPQPNVVSYTALIAGHARVGDAEASALCYEAMCLTGVEPDAITFLTLLSACTNAGAVEKGLEYFESMGRDYGISAELEHYACVIDLVGRAGLFQKAEALLAGMPMEPDLPVWLCVLGACRKHRNVVLGERAFNQAVRLEPLHGAAYVLMCNVYADAGMQDCANEVDEVRQSRVAWKEPGQSWIEHQGKVHTFLVGDRRHHQEAQLYALLDAVKADLTRQIV